MGSIYTNCSTTKFSQVRNKATQNPYPGRTYIPGSGNLLFATTFTTDKHLKQAPPKATQPGHTHYTRVQFKPPETQKPQTVFKNHFKPQSRSKPKPHLYIHSYIYTQKAQERNRPNTQKSAPKQKQTQAETQDTNKHHQNQMHTAK